MAGVKIVDMKKKQYFLITFILFLALKNTAQSNIDSTSIYFNLYKYDKAIKYAYKHNEYDTLINKGIILLNNSDFKNANSFLSTAYNLNEKTNTEIEKITLLNIIGICYKQVNDFDNAEKYYKKAISLNTTYSDEYFKSLNALVRLYCETKNFLTSEKQCKIFLEESKKYKGENSNEYILALNQLCLHYLDNDSFKLGEVYCLKFVEVNKLNFGAASNEYLSALSLYVNLLNRKGELFKAEKHSLDIINIYSKYNKVDYKELSLYYNQLATIQQNLLKYDLAKSNFLKAIELIEKNYGNNNLYYSLFAENFAVLNIILNNFADAEFYLKKALEIKISLQNSNVDILYSNLAAVYQKTNRCEEALKYQLKSIENINNTLNETYKTKILGIALTYNCLKNPQKEFENLLTVSNILKENVFDIATFMSNVGIQQYIQQYFHNRIYPLSFLTRNPIDFEKLNISCYEEELMFKNLSLHNSDFVKKSIKGVKNAQSELIYSTYIENKKQIAKLNELPIEAKPNGFENLILETENLEKYLVQQSYEFSKSKNAIALKWKFLQSKLNSTEISIDIVDFIYYNNKKVPDSIVYAAFLVDKNSKFPKFIPLFEEKQLAFLLERNKTQQYSSRIDKQYFEKTISDLFLKPLEKELNGITTIYLSLSGLTHQINLAALPINENQTFGQKYKIHILNSPSELMDYTVSSFDNKNKLDFILYGNIDYDKRNIISNKDSVDNQYFVNVDEEIKDLQTRSGISSFGYLTGTKNEIHNINMLAHKSDFKAIIFDDRNATEESIKQLDGKSSPFVLHLATHGFFFPNPIIEISNDKLIIEGKSKIFKASDDPMMRSGLVFSGANKSWGKVNDNQSGDDGILTASEISNLDLSACQLVVLSACETGLGEVKGSEGVFGLQRAFKMAGVKNIIMSLWKVPDSQTAELFDIFYSECFAGKTIHEAFQTAQAKMKVKYSPYYWAGFVLLE